MSDLDPYVVLGVERDVTDAEIKTRYRELMRAWHPDINERPEATERTAAINAAWEILSDPQLRASFDRGTLSFEEMLRGWVAEKMRVWAVKECVWCGEPLYEGVMRHYRR